MAGKPTEQSKEIKRRLLNGEAPAKIQKDLTCSPESVYGVIRSDNFATLCLEELKKRININSLAALHNILEIANDKKVSHATRVKANQYILDKAIELNITRQESENPENMTRDQLAERLEAVESEMARRAKSISHNSDNKADTSHNNIDDLM